jgi:hypothetical protein
MRITSGYDDGTSVMLTFEITRAGQPDRPLDTGQPSTVVTDSAGHRMEGVFTPVRQALSTTTIAYSRPLGGPAAGTPLVVQSTDFFLLGSRTRVSGSWTMRLSLRPSPPMRELPLPAGGRLGTGTIEFETVRVNDAILHVQFTSDDVTPGCQAKGCGMTVNVYGPDGTRLTMLNAGGSLPGQAGRFEQREEWQLAAAPGTYRMVFVAQDGSTLEREIAVPNGRSTRVPRVPDHYAR